jgi:D-cysteine desulfhydrase
MDRSDRDRFPRRGYGPLPTRIDAMPRLTRALGGASLYIKRDDTLDLLGGGNKARKLDLLMADAIARGADSIVTCGAVQSNHCRLALSAAAREGLAGHLVLWERPFPNQMYDPDASGNAFLYHLLGVASITLVQDHEEMGPTMEAVAARLRAEGHRPYVIPGGGSNGLGALGYALCAIEIEEQAKEMGVRFDTLVLVTGGGGTQAGLLAGFGPDSGVRVQGISVSGSEEEAVSAVRAVLRKMEATLGQDLGVLDAAVFCTDRFVGPGYALPTDEMHEAVEMAARLEGVMLDPAYTGKAMAALIALARDGTYGPDQNVLFLHTGGVPALFAHTGEFLARSRAGGRPELHTRAG